MKKAGSRGTGRGVSRKGIRRPDYGLSPRETQILQLIVDGYSNREMAVHLGLSARTIAAHRASIMSTLRVNKVTKLVAYALRNGLAR